MKSLGDDKSLDMRVGRKLKVSVGFNYNNAKQMHCEAPSQPYNAADSIEEDVAANAASPHLLTGIELAEPLRKKNKSAGSVIDRGQSIYKRDNVPNPGDRNSHGQR